jgi:hypothetical protein
MVRALANLNLQTFPTKSFNGTQTGKETFLRDGTQNGKLKKCAIFCTALWKFVLLRNALQFVAQSFCDQSNIGFVAHVTRSACAPALT